MESFEHRGYWWLPENPDNQIAGVLTFTPRTGAKLELIGAFQSLIKNPLDIHPIILGINAKGKSITLHNCQKSSHSFIDFSFETSDYRIRTVFIGFHAFNESDLKFIKTQVKYTYLYNWVGISGFSRNFSDGDEDRKFQLTYLMPKDICLSTKHGSISFSFGVNIKTNYDVSNLTENTFIHIECNEECRMFEIFTNFLSPLQYVINLGTAKPNFIEELILFHKDSPDDHIAVYFSQTFYQPKVKENLILEDMIFALSDIYEDLENKINNWIIASQELESVLHLFTKARIASEMFLELKFLTIAQAIETYHRRRRNGAALSKEDHKLRMKEILGNVPDTYKKWLKQALAFSNEKSLKMRLDELMDEKNEIMQPIVNDKENFIKKVRDTRNYFTHYDQRMEAKAAKGTELHWLTEKLLILLQSCLISEVGIPLEQQVTFFRRNQQYIFLKNKTAQ